MKPRIIEDYTKLGIDAGCIVRRFLSQLPENIFEGLNEVRLLNNNEIGFASMPEAAKDLLLQQLAR